MNGVNHEVVDIFILYVELCWVKHHSLQDAYTILRNYTNTIVY